MIGVTLPEVSWTDLARFVKAAVSGGFDVAKVLLVLRRCGPGGVRGRRRQHQEEGMHRAPGVQEVERAIRLNDSHI